MCTHKLYCSTAFFIPEDTSLVLETYFFLNLFQNFILKIILRSQSQDVNWSRSQLLSLILGYFILISSKNPFFEARTPNFDDPFPPVTSHKPNINCNQLREIGWTLLVGLEPRQALGLTISSCGIWLCSDFVKQWSLSFVSVC